MTSDGFTTCLWFDDQAEEAAQYYVSVFEDSDSHVGDITHYPEGGHRPAGTVLTVEFTANGQKFVALNGGPEFRFTEAISFQVTCETQEEVDHYSARLTENGGELGPCGWVKDRFGVSWQVVPRRLMEMFADPDPAKAARANKAMESMRKLDIAALEQAFAGER
ncbi:VOC family protein [Streptomyces sp. NPDC090994]|uniref:VOC family protein n=1 Tax=Streptomyces sp. NPDC090994 TaxID=3365969 RepID=UPI00382E7C7B